MPQTRIEKPSRPRTRASTAREAAANRRSPTPEPTLHTRRRNLKRLCRPTNLHQLLYTLRSLPLGPDGLPAHHSYQLTILPNILKFASEHKLRVMPHHIFTAVQNLLEYEYIEMRLNPDDDTYTIRVRRKLQDKLEETDAELAASGKPFATERQRFIEYSSIINRKIEVFKTFSVMEKVLLSREKYKAEALQVVSGSGASDSDDGHDTEMETEPIIGSSSSAIHLNSTTIDPRMNTSASGTTLISEAGPMITPARRRPTPSVMDPAAAYPTPDSEPRRCRTTTSYASLPSPVSPSHAGPSPTHGEDIDDDDDDDMDDRPISIPAALTTVHTDRQTQTEEYGDSNEDEDEDPFYGPFPPTIDQYWDLSTNLDMVYGFYEQLEEEHDVLEREHGLLKTSHADLRTEHLHTHQSYKEALGRLRLIEIQQADTLQHLEESTHELSRLRQDFDDFQAIFSRLRPETTFIGPQDREVALRRAEDRLDAFERSEIENQLLREQVAEQETEISSHKRLLRYIQGLSLADVGNLPPQ